MKRSLAERFEALLDRLDNRMETQALRPCADDPDLVALVGTFHRTAGNAERRAPLSVDFGDVKTLARYLRLLHNVVCVHAILLRQRQLRATADRAVALAKVRDVARGEK